MTGCGEGLDGLSAKLDGALPPRERDLVDGHLAACPECDRRLRSLRALKHAIARLPSREAPPGAVRVHVESLVFRGRRSGRLRLVLQAALAAGVLLAAWAYVSGRHGAEGPTAKLAEELAADHLHSVPEAMPAEVATEDPAEVIRFFSGRLPFTPVAPRLEGAHLIGARLCKIEGRRVQLLFYRDDSDVTLSLFVGDHGLSAGSGCRETRGLRVCSRTLDGLSLHVVGAAPRDHLRRMLERAAY